MNSLLTRPDRVERMSASGRIAPRRFTRHWRGTVRSTRRWPARRVGLVVVVGLLLLSAVWLGQVAPLLAQEGVGIRFDDLSREPTETTVDRFGVELSNLDAAATYAVVVASDNATALGIGAAARRRRRRR